MVSHALAASLRVDVGVGQLHLHYAVKNHESRAAYLFNLLHRGTAESIDEELCYVELVPLTRTVVVSKRIPDLPSDRRVYQPFSPYVTRVAPGDEFTETLTLALPLRERHEYRDVSKEPRTHQRYTSLRLRLGYFLAPEGTRDEIEEAAGRRIVRPVIPVDRKPEFGELVAEQRGLSLSVMAP